VNISLMKAYDLALAPLAAQFIVVYEKKSMLRIRIISAVEKLSNRIENTYLYSFCAIEPTDVIDWTDVYVPDILDDNLESSLGSSC
jgi:hypothetical protein